MPKAGEQWNFPRIVAAALLLLVLLIAGATYGIFYHQTGNINQLILSGHYKEATEKIDRWTWLPLVSGGLEEQLGTTELLQKGYAFAAPHFARSSPPAAIYPAVLDFLWSHGRYDDGIAYVGHIRNAVAKDATVPFYLSGFLAGKNQLEDALSELSAASHVSQLAGPWLLLNTEIESRLSRKEYTFILDRENLPLVSLDFNGQPSVLEDVGPVLKNQSGDYLSKLKADRFNEAVLTLDYRMQSAAKIALGKYAGAIVVIDPRTGDILAATGNTRGMGSVYPQGTALAFDHYYEPGSIMKMITLAGAIEHGVDVAHFFPMNCEGYIDLGDGKQMYDWKPHGQLKDVDAATAVSCNVAFAKIGLATKQNDLLTNLHAFGFDSVLRNAFLPFPLGKIIPGDGSGRYVSNLSIGLKNVQITPFHAALLAAAVANHGICPMPRLLLERRNIIGIPFDRQQTATYARFMSDKTASIIEKAMEAVITAEEGTGHRAAMENFRFAMKTGTAGEGAKGYNAIVIGFGPIPNPRIAFAIFLEHAGRAEFEGARVTKLFLESIQGYIK